MFEVLYIILILIVCFLIYDEVICYEQRLAYPLILNIDVVVRIIIIKSVRTK